MGLEFARIIPVVDSEARPIRGGRFKPGLFVIGARMSSSSLPLWPEADSSFFGDFVRLEGSLRFTGKFLLDGQFKGEIEGRGRLEIGSSAQAAGKIIADELIHHGCTEGDLIAIDKLDLRAGCLHRGDIQALRVQISPEARLEGVLKMPDSSPGSASNFAFNRYRNRFAVGIIVLFLAGAGATTAIGKLPGIWNSVEGRIKRLASLAQSFPLRSAPRMSNASKNQREESFLGEALLREREEKFPEAAALLERAVLLNGKNSRLARFRLAKNFARLGRNEDAIGHLNELLKEAPGHIGGMILLGDLYAGAGRFQKAVFAYAAAVRHDPADLVLRRRLEKVRARIGGGRRSGSRMKDIPSLSRILDEVERLLGEKKPVQAVKVVRKGIAALPDEPRLYFQLGSSLTEIADRNGAIEAYQRVIQLAPDWLDAYARLGALLEASRRYKEAVAMYRRAADLHPSNLDMLVRIPLIEMRRNRRDKAYRMLLKMREDHPKSTVILLELGMLLWKSGKAAESKAVFLRVLELDPNSAPALNRLAWFHVQGKNLERGVELSKRSLDIRPDTPLYLDTLAELYFRSHQPVKSIPLIQRAIELEPSNRYYRVQLDKFKRARR